jgi:hypothetical protein
LKQFCAANNVAEPSVIDSTVAAVVLLITTIAEFHNGKNLIDDHTCACQQNHPIKIEHVCKTKLKVKMIFFGMSLQKSNLYWQTRRSLFHHRRQR